MHRLNWSLLSLFSICLIGISSSVSAQDFLRLRDGKTLTGISVRAVTVDGVYLTTDARISWGQIQSGGVNADHREKFDKYLKGLSEPLYLIGQRLRVRDDSSLTEIIGQVDETISLESGPTAMLINTASFWGLVASGRREEAALPLLTCYLLSQSTEAIGADVPEGRAIQFDTATGFSADLLPIWHDSKAAKQVLPKLNEMLSKLDVVPESTFIMYSTLALAARQHEEADRILKQFSPTRDLTKNIASAIRLQRAYLLGDDSGLQLVNAVEPTIRSMEIPSQIIANYWSGLVLLKSTNDLDQQKAMLHLITVAGKHGQRYPQLAASSLYAIYNLLADERDRFVVGLSKAERQASRAAIRHEIVSRYSATSIAKRFEVASEDDRTNEDKTNKE
tara:strand:- start:10815 stop:11990 length:1176 start_codon:yes stop_codon:yes gene_type:complete